MSKWTFRTIEQVCQRVLSGGTPSRKNQAFYAGEIPWVKTKELKDCRLFSAEEHITPEAVAASSAKLFPVNTVLMAMYGATVGKLAIAGIELTTNQAACAMIVDEEIADYRFLFYLLKNARKRIIDLANGAAQQNLSVGVIKQLEFAYPPLETQKAISSVLATLDDKIESNRRQHNLLESLADALFQKEEKGIVKISDVAEVVMGSSPRGTSYNENGEGVPFYQGVRDFDARYPTLRVWTSEPVRFAQENDTLFSVRAPVGRLNRASEKCCVGRGLAAIRSDYPSTLYYALRSVSSSWDAYEQEGTVFGAINKTDLSNTELNWPSNEHQKALEERLSVIDKKISSLWRENRLLAETRDVLMPDLLSGRVQLSEDGKLIFPQD